MGPPDFPSDGPIPYYGVARLPEGVTAGAGSPGVGVVDRESLLLDGVGEVDRAPREVGHTHPVDDDFDPVEAADGVPVELAFIEVQLVDQSGTAARLHGNAQAQVVAPFLLQQCRDLAGGDVG